MVGVIMGIVVLTMVVLAFTLDPQVKRCEHCEGPVTLKEFWSHFKRCSETKKK